MRPPRLRVLESALAGVLGVLLFATGSMAGTDGSANKARRQALDHYKAGEAALSSERFEQAVEEFRKAIALDPVLVMAHYGLGQAHMALKEYSAAVNAYIDCRKAFHEDLADQLQSSTGWQVRLDQQIRTIQDQIATLNSSGRSTAPATRPASSHGALDLQQQLDTLQMRRNLDTTVPVKTPPWISVALGSAYLRGNAFSDAEREYTAALEVDPKVGEAHNNLAVVYLLTNRGEEAEREVDLAERAGFKIPDGLKRQIAQLRGAQAKP